MMRARAVIAIVMERRTIATIVARCLLVAAAMIIMKCLATAVAIVMQHLATAVAIKLVLAGIASLLETTIIARAAGI